VNLKTAVSILIAIAMLIIGFASGYAYTSRTVATPPQTITYAYTETSYRTVTSAIYVTATSTLLYTTTLQVLSTTTKIEHTTITTAYTETVTQVGTVTTTMTTTVAPRNQTVLRYPFESSARVDFNDDGRSDMVVEINPWNMRSAKGEQRIVIDIPKKSIEVYVNLTDVNPPEWANGYPEIIIGGKPWHSSYTNGLGIPFPMKVREATPFTISFYICIKDLHPSMNFNIAADAWIVRESIAKSLGRAPGNGDLEIMVWLFNQNLNPAGGKVGEATIPIVLNGTIVEAQWEVWRMDSVSWGGWQYIAFKPKGWRHACGYVAYNPIDFVKASANFATFDISDYYILGWEIGTEWGARTSNGVARFLWILKDFTAILGAAVQKP